MNRPSRHRRLFVLTVLVAVLLAWALPVVVTAQTQDAPVRDVLNGPTGGRRFT